MRGHDLLLDSDGAVFWPDQRLLAVADLHLEKGTAAASRGSLLPPWDTKITLDRVETLLNEGKEDEAKREWVQFRKQYPQYAAPEALDARITAIGE